MEVVVVVVVDGRREGGGRKSLLHNNSLLMRGLMCNESRTSVGGCRRYVPSGQERMSH